MNLNPKVVNSAFAGALVTVIVFFIGAFSSLEVPPEIAAAIVVVISTAFGYSTSALPLDGEDGGSGNDNVPERFF